MGCSNTKNIPEKDSPPSNLPQQFGPIEFHEIKKEMNHGFKQDYFAKKVTAKVKRLWFNKHYYDKDSQEWIDKAVSFLLKKREELDIKDDMKMGRFERAKSTGVFTNTVVNQPLERAETVRKRRHITY